MANPNPPLENLKPFKPGQSGNPKGKPKGRRNLATVVRDLLEQEIDWNSIPLKDSAKFSEMFKGKTAGEALVLSAMAKALSGDGQAREWLRKSGYGDKLDLTSGEKPIPILGGLVVHTDDGTEKDSPDAEADQGDSGGDLGIKDGVDPDAADSDSPDEA